MFRHREDLEERLLRIARTRGHTPAGDRAVARFSSLGEHGRVWLAIGIAGGLAQSEERRPAWRRARRTVMVTFIANTALKLAVGRRRPQLTDLPPLTGTPTGLSFPSAHTATGFAGALAYSRLGVPALPLYGLAVALGYSRLYLGVHYPSDVLAGAVFGSAIAAVLAPAPNREGGQAA